MKMIPRRFFSILTGSVLTLLPAYGVEVEKAANTIALNSDASWAAGLAPGLNDVALWDAAISTVNASQLGGDVAWQGIRVTNVGGTRNGTANNLTIASTASANTLTLGNAGIDMASALQALIIQSKVNLSASQVWNISNANNNAGPAGLAQNEDLSFFPLAAAVPFNMGANTVTKTGVGVAAFTSGYTISNGSFLVDAGILHIQGGSNRTTTVGGDVAFTVNTGATLRFAIQSAPAAGGVSLQMNGSTTLNTGSTLAILINQANQGLLTGNIAVAGNTTISVFGGSTGTNIFSGNLTGTGNIAYVNTATSSGFLQMTGQNSGYSGTLSLSGATGLRKLRLASATAGSAAATWAVNADNLLEIDGVPVELGTLNGAGRLLNSHANNPAVATIASGTFSGVLADGTFPGLGLTKIGPGTLTLTGANTYTGPTIINAGTLSTTTQQTGAGSIALAGGAAFAINLVGAGTSFNASSFAVGPNGGTIIMSTGALGNPIAPVLIAPSFSASAGTVLMLTGSTLAAGNNIPLVDYSDSIGGGGFAALSVVLPTRVSGRLVNNLVDTRVDLNITGFDLPRWKGAISSVWDVDNGTGTGTANWREVASGNPTRYLQGAGGTDSVLFDDSATAGAVTLNTALTPLNTTIKNTTLTYTFSGDGKLSGAGPLLKQGSGTLILANSTAYDHTGGTFISAGTLQIGDPTLPGLGVLPLGAIINDATLSLNRPDDFSISSVLNPISGAGLIRKTQSSTVNFTTATTYGGPVAIQEGALRFDAGGNLSGTLSGTGQLVINGGTLQLSGTDANTQAQTLVSGGTLQLNKAPGVAAVGGDITIANGGTLAMLGSDQIPDTATINFVGTSGDSTVGSTGSESVANVIVNPTVGTGQFIARNGFTVLDTATLKTGILGVASSHSATFNGVAMSGGTLRIAGNGGPSILNIGPGGINASGGVIEIKFTTANQDATLNLGGDFTATGFISINNASYTGANLNVINLTDTRTFTIAEGTTTTVQPDISGPGGLIKKGGGTLFLQSSSDGTYGGETTVSEGTLVVAGSISGSAALNVGGLGRLQLGGNERLNDLASVGLIGGTLDTSGFSETAGTLTLAGSATIDLGFGGSVLRFADSHAAAWSGALTITNWSGSMTGGGADQIFFGLDQGGLASAQIGRIEFLDPEGFDPGTYRALMLSTGEIVATAVPEPGSLGLLLSGLVLGLRRRSRA